MPDRATISRLKDLGVPLKTVARLGNMDYERLRYGTAGAGSLTPAEAERVAVVVSMLTIVHRRFRWDRL